MHVARCLCPLLLALVAVSASGQEWTRFRGPNGTGLAPAVNVPDTWTAADFNWQVELPGGGHSSPVLWGNRIFLTGADEANQTRFAFCINAADGTLLWRRDYPLAVHDRHQFNSFASPTAAVDEERVYFTWSSPSAYTLFALDHEGQDVWQRDFGTYESQHSCGTSPIVYEDLVILPNDQDATSSLIAVDRQTGDTVWQTPRRTGKTAYSTPCVYQPEGRAAELIFNADSHGICGVRPADGKMLWEVNVFDKRSCSSPVLAAGLVFGSCGSGGGGNYLVAVRPGGDSASAAPEQAYRFEDNAPYVPTPLAKDDMLFLWSDKGVVSCMDPATAQVHWRRRVSGNFFGSPICIGDRLLCVSCEGEAVVLAASKEFAELGRTELSDPLCHTTPAVAAGRLYIRADRHLYSLGK